MEKKQAVVGDYVVTARIGSGSFAIVYKGYHKVTNVPVAVKAINKQKLNPKLLENLESEISIMRQINHPNIVKLYDIKKTEKHIYLMLEYCDGGDLQHFIKKQPNGVVSEDTARHFLRELADGLHVLWSLNLIHRDLKPQNLLLSEASATASLKIADFGFARHLESTSLAETLCGSPLYMAPEILQFQKYDSKADLWSVGTILYEMVVGRPPFNGANQVQLLHNIQRESVRFPKDLPVGRDAINLMEGLLVRDPKRRISFDQFFNAPFLNRPSPSSLTASAVALPASLVRTNPVDITPSSDLNASSPGVVVTPSQLKLHDSYRASMMQSYRRRSASSSTANLKASLLGANPPVASHHQPVSPDLVPISMSSLRINPFKSDTPPSTQSSSTEAALTMVTSTSAPASAATGGYRHLMASRSPQINVTMASSPAGLPVVAAKPLSSPTAMSPTTTSPSAGIVHPLADSNAPSHSLAVAVTRNLGLELNLQVDTMLARVQAILGVVDLFMGPPADTNGGLVLSHPSGTSSISSSTNSSTHSSPASSFVGQDKSGSRYHAAASSPEHALLLAMTCMHLLHMVVAQEDAAAKQGWIKALLVQCIDKAEQCKQDMLEEKSAGSTTASVEDLLYGQVVRLGREAAVHEVLGQKGLASDLYSRAQLLLESILIAASTITLQHDDRLRLVHFWHAFNQRLVQCSINEPPHHTVSSYGSQSHPPPKVGGST
ncbi:ULK/ULK protein kinase [Aphanomyces invadans]|uniref:ULK/ULK protein kinase n=1 Tax=Aphanomyces invadans TaxID=157072 RepID=A0A024TZI0_9STRA|nr:ULK/ULK protein kinase [Aphanomyces invadans]ETV99388.1 ULK/ULK protein kinase [Aphanomyces invadans]|eukprot:XP_008871944.1 ULK/ULK protein kinase [Aphanomyces invadans]